MKMYNKSETSALTSNWIGKTILKSKRSQVSETMNWVIATIVIIVVLLICFFIADGKLFDFNLNLFSDKQQDFVITKSTENFVDENFNLIQKSVEDNNYVELNEKLDSFLTNLPVVDESSWGWSFVLKNSENKSLFIKGYTSSYYRKIEFSFNELDNFKIIFGEQCKECQPIYNIPH